MNLLPSISFLIFFFFLGLGFYAISREPDSALNRVFFAITICAAIWLGAYSCIFYINISEQWIWFWFKVSSLGWISLAAFGMHFALVLTGKNRRMRKWMIALLYIPAVVEIILINTVILPAQFFDLSKSVLFEFISPQQSWFWVIHTLYFLSYCVVILVMVARWGSHSSSLREKRQARIIVPACLAVLCSVIFTYIIFPVFGYWIPSLVMAVGLIWAFSILYAMIKYQLMDLASILIIDDILTQVTDIVILADRSGRITMANNKAADILGYSVEEMQQMHLITIIPNEKLRNIAISDQNEINMEMEVNYQTARGELIPVKAYFAAITDRLQDIVGILVIGQDLRLTKQLEHKIEEKDQAELALRESEAKYRDLFENANDLIYMHDLEGKFLYANKATEKLLGYTSGELVHFNTLDTVAPGQLQTVIDTFNQSKNENRPVFYEVSVINRYGEVYELDVNRRLIYENDNLIYQCVARDITERKRMEEKLKYLSMHDSMTGLYNRAYFSEEMNRLESGRCDPVGIMVCDLDDLKKVNDSIGHNAGDEMIIAAAQLIQSCFRENDVVARFGGDEFAIVLPYSNEDVCINLADKIKSAVEEFNKISPNIIGVSVGFAVRCSPLQRMNEVLKQADHAMYVDKAARKKTAKIS